MTYDLLNTFKKYFEDDKVVVDTYELAEGYYYVFDDSNKFEKLQVSRYNMGVLKNIFREIMIWRNNCYGNKRQKYMDFNNFFFFFISNRRTFRRTCSDQLAGFGG